MADTAAQTETVTINLDGREVQARPGEMVIAAAERAGVFIPRFCYHPRLDPVGMCRMCLVNIDSGRGPALQPACVIPVAEGMTVDTTAANVAKAQDGVLEFLLINHPLDCPVCDRGGECPLQDQTVAFGPGESRFVEEKRHFEKPIPISDLVYLDRERCILCDRCTRFAADVAGDPLITFSERGNQTQIATFPDDPFASYFSINTVQLCPVGALTSRPYRFKARPWDLDGVESTCTTCSVGCRVVVQSSNDEVIRLLGVDADPVNHGWLCDKGRIAYEAAQNPDRIVRPRLRRDGELIEVGWAEALAEAADRITQALDAGGPGRVGVIGGARLTNEDAYAWTRLAKGVIGTDNVDAQLGDGLPPDLVLGAPRASIDDACSAPVVVALAPDLKEELPVLYLRLRAAVRAGTVRLVELTPQSSALTPFAAASLRYRPGEVAHLAAALRDGADREVAGVAPDDIAAARELLGFGADQPETVILLGRPSVAEPADAVVDAASVLLTSLEGATVLPVLRRGNVHGALDMGLAPGLLPGRVTLDAGRSLFSEQWGRVPDARGLDTAGMLEAAAAGELTTLILLGADPRADFPDRDLAHRALSRVDHVIAVDLFETASVEHADIVLPAAGPHERSGTTTNVEGRVSLLGRKVTAPGTARQDWMTATELARRLDGDLGFTDTASIWAEVERLSSAHVGITAAVLAAPAWRDGVPAPLPAAPVAITGSGRADGDDEAPPAPEGEAGDRGDVAGERVGDAATEATTGTGSGGVAVSGVAALGGAAEVPPDDAGGSPAPRPAEHPPMVAFDPAPRVGEVPALDSYSLRLIAGRRLYDSGVLTQRSPSLAHLPPGPRLRVNPFDLDRLGVTTGDRVRVASARTSLELTAEVDDRVPRGSAALDFNQPGVGAADLIDAAAGVCDVRVETVA